MKKIFVDTNIFLRYLTRDELSKYEKCKELFKKALEKQINLITSGIVIAELVWTLLSYYRVSKSEVIEKVSIIISTENLSIPDKDIIAEALVLYGRKNIDYIDAYNSVLMRTLNSDEIYSYDRDFDNIEGIKRKEP